MKKRIENIKKQAAKEGLRLTYVIAGFVAGRAFAAGMDWLASKYPEHEGIFKYSKAPVLGATGVFLTMSSDPSAEFEKHFGYGITASAAFEGIKIIPVAKDYLGEINFEPAYYREDEKPAIQIGDFGIKSLPIKSVEIGEVKPIEVDLPELEGAANLGYNKAYTDDLGYNRSATEDADMNGII